jgi:hypothetical protein
MQGIISEGAGRGARTEAALEKLKIAVINVTIQLFPRYPDAKKTVAKPSQAVNSAL